MTEPIARRPWRWEQRTDNRGRTSYLELLVRHLDAAIEQLGDVKASHERMLQLRDVYRELEKARDYAERLNDRP